VCVCVSVCVYVFMRECVCVCVYAFPEHTCEWRTQSATEISLDQGYIYIFKYTSQHLKRIIKIVLKPKCVLVLGLL